MSMIVMSIIRIASGHSVTPVKAEFSQLPNLFGVAVYSFMCQHSLPGEHGQNSNFEIWNDLLIDCSAGDAD